ncbi:MAG: radical SAM family heme chaperone HemW, partial [Planctomycetales bacterium]|nr:radical SAM family heme chaperone HemW [Planctomycetales bacterium]
MMPARSAYIHVPFCDHRCGYCNFTLVAGRDDLVSAYLDALQAELWGTLAEPLEVDTIFLGGGTPSHLPAAELQRLLDTLRTRLLLSPTGEFSCEANPLDCTPQRLSLLRDYGVNRISLGGQSFHDSKLQVLERDHTGEQLRTAVERCAEYFSNVSLDLIFAAPGESLADWQADLRRAMDSPLQHVSSYGLTIERGSAFYGRVLKNQLSELSSEEQLAMYEHAIDALVGRGWEHYEVSSFCRPGFRCRHNEAY